MIARGRNCRYNNAIVSAVEQVEQNAMGSFQQSAAERRFKAIPYPGVAAKAAANLKMR